MQYVIPDAALIGNSFFLATRALGILTLIPASIQIVQTGGYALAGDGGGASFNRVAGPLTDLASFQSADGAWWQYAPLDNIINVRAFGAVGDNVADDTNAFESAIYAGLPTLVAVTVRMPAGKYRLSRQIIPFREVTLIGDGVDGTELHFKNVAAINTTMKGAISFGIATTLAAYVVNPGYTAGVDGADYSTASNFSIYIEGTRPANFDWGVWNASRLSMQNVFLHSCGLKNTAGNLIIAGVGNIAGNANKSVFINVQSFSSTAEAFLTDGADCNGISFISCQAFIPNTIGFYDASLLGNNYNGCLREGVTGSTVNGYKTFAGAGTNRSLFTSCYNEGDATTGSRWNIAPPGAIIQWQGAAPEYNLGGGKNTILFADDGGGWITTQKIDVAANGDNLINYPASRIATNGLFIRAADNSLASITPGGGDGVYLVRDGIPVMKIALGAPISNPIGGATVDNEARAAINLILTRMRNFTPTIEP